MQVPLQISFHGMDHSGAVEARILEKAKKLERFHDRITACRVTVEAPHRHQHKGKLYRIRIDITTPGGAELVVRRSPDDEHAHEDVYVAIRDAFNAAARLLEDRARTQRGDIKTHAAPLHGRIAALPAEADYGFVELSDGQEVYFHRNSVLDGSFDKLVVGTEVRVTTAMGEKGLQASSVQPIGKHHIGANP